jgi:hypothetical protein
MTTQRKKDTFPSIPDLHQQAHAFKNRKRLQRDGGRAWIRDSQLQEMRRGANGRLETVDGKLDSIFPLEKKSE